MRYRIQLAQRWQFHPRDLDRLTLDEFDHFAAQSDAMDREDDKQRREAEARARR